MSTEKEQVDYAAHPAVVAAKALAITSPELYAQAGELLTSNKALQKQITDSYGPLKKKAKEAHQAVCDEEKRHLRPLVEAETHLKNGLRSFDDAERAKAEVERQRLQREADAEADRQRKEAEARAAASKRPETIQKHLDTAAAIQAPVIAVATAAPKIDGVHRVETWKWKIIDESKIPRHYLVVNEAALTSLARSLKDKAQVEGVQFFRDTIISARGK